VKAYLGSGVALPPASYYNAEGRGEPDVAAVGSMGLMVVMGSVIVEGGTSMSSPIFAGVASLLNEVALNKTGQPLGFLNPLLYQMAADAPDTFHDITEGDNICPEEFCGPQCKGYQAIKGWVRHQTAPPYTDSHRRLQLRAHAHLLCPLSPVSRRIPLLVSARQTPRVWRRTSVGSWTGCWPGALRKPPRLQPRQRQRGAKGTRGPRRRLLRPS
jgi:hypothetical protein